MQGFIQRALKFETLLGLFLAVALFVMFAAALIHRREAPPLEVVEAVTALEPIVVFPDFSSFPDVDVKKQMFFDFLELYIAAENKKVALTRAQLMVFAEITSRNFRLSHTERRQLMTMARDYNVETEGVSERRLVNELLKRVDIIPVSLALAQAANESAWGTSRFALEGNNIFGQWCYEQGCGLVPTRRLSSATHEVRSFATIESAVEAYFENLNTHAEYEHFRELRFQMRGQKGELNSLVLAYGLAGYSERGENYVDELQTIIQQNGLRDRDYL
ncbi:MAG: glucosaminidase domain-containing protein [Pseudohongiellaceae bacterium]